MAAVPKYTGRARENLSSSMDFMAPAREANTIAQGIGNISQGAQQVMDSQRKMEQADFLINQKLQDHQEKQDIQNAELEFLRRSKDATFKAKQEFQSNPQGVTEFLLEEQNKMRQDIVGGLSSARARDAFSNQLEKGLIAMDYDIKNWQVNQTIENTKVKNDEIAQAAGTAAYEAGAAGNSLESLQTSLLDIDLAYEASSEVLSPKERQDFLVTKKNESVLSYAQGLVDNNNLTAARKLLKSEEHREILGAKGISKVHNMVQSKIEQNEARAEKLKNKRDKDPWFGVGQEAGFIQFDPVNDPEGNTLRNGLLMRDEYRKGLAMDSRESMPFLRPEEAKVFKTYVDKLRPEQAAGFLQWFDNNTTTRDQVNIGQSIYRNTDDVAMAVGITLASDAPKDAELMVRGKRFFDAIQTGKDSTPRTGKDTFLSPSSKSIMDAFERTYNPTTIVSPEQRKMAVEAAFYHYVGQKSVENQPFSDDLDENQFKRSLESVIGPVAKYQGQDIVMFRNAKTGQYIDEVDVSTAMNMITPDDLEKIQGSRPITTLGEDAGFEKFTQASLSSAMGYGRIKLRNGYGTGNFLMVTSDGRAMIDSKTGQPFQLNLKAIIESDEMVKKQAEWTRNMRESVLKARQGPKF